MTKHAFNRGLNYLLYCAGLFLTGSGHDIGLEATDRRGFILLGLSRHDWGDLHLVAGLVLAAGVFIHLALHWKWIWHVALQRIPSKAWIGLLLPFLLCLGLLALPLK